MKPILGAKRDLVLEMSTLLCKPLTKDVDSSSLAHFESETEPLKICSG